MLRLLRLIDFGVHANASHVKQFRITMAAIDPSAEPEHTGTSKKGTSARATLKIIYDPASPEDDASENSDDEEEYLKGLLAGREDDDDEDDEDDEDEEDEDEQSGEKSEKAKASKARREAAVKQLLQELKDEDSDAEVDDDDEGDELMEVDDAPKVNGVKKSSSKGSIEKTSKGGEDEEDDEDDDEDSMDGMEEMVVCTLDPEKVDDAFRMVEYCYDADAWSTALPTNTRYHCSRGSDSVLQSLWHACCIYHRKLCDPSGRQPRSRSIDVRWRIRRL